MRASDYSDIGRYLKDSRESLKLSITDAARAMHIRVHYVEALETGNLEILPGKAYVRGYIKNYALFLGINAEEALDAYDSLSVATKPELYIPEPTSSENLPSRALTIIVLIVAVLGGGYYLFGSKATHIASSRIAEVPGALALAAESTRNEHNAQWMECLNNDVNECFNSKYAEEFIAQIEQDYGQVFHYLAEI